jgi:hypothetical protein
MGFAGVTVPACLIALPHSRHLLVLYMLVFCMYFWSRGRKGEGSGRTRLLP